MNQSLTEFKPRYRELVLNFLWRQWSALGIAGHAAAEDARIVDPEALLLLTCTIGRYDARVFDEVLDWLLANGRFINVLRLKRIQNIEKFAGARVLAAVAGLLCKGAEVPKWRQLADAVVPSSPPEDLFFLENGKPLLVLGEPEPHFVRYGWKRGPLRLRGYSKEFRPVEPANLGLQLRALFGINARAETVAYLLTHEMAHPSQIARDAYYHERAIQGTLVEMSQSGIVQVRTTKREKRYWLDQAHWATLLNRPAQFPKWITWPPLFSALEQIWLRLDDPRLLELDALTQSSFVRQLMVEVRSALERAGFDRVLSDDRQYLGETYLPVFFSDVCRLLG